MTDADEALEAAAKAIFRARFGQHADPEWPVGIDRLGYHQEPYIDSIPKWKWEGCDRDARAALTAASAHTGERMARARHQYDAKLGEITDQDREYAADLMDDLELKPGSEEQRNEIALWFRKVRYEAVMKDRDFPRSASPAPEVPAVCLRDITSITDALIERSDKFRAVFSRAELEEHVAMVMAPHQTSAPRAPEPMAGAVEGWPQPQNTVDKAEAWDAIAEKNKRIAEYAARIEQLEAVIKRYLADDFSCNGGAEMIFREALAASPPDGWSDAISAVVAKLHEYGCPSGIIAKVRKLRPLPSPPGEELGKG